MKFIKRKKLMLSVLLVVALVGIGVTVALSFATSNPVENSFEAAEHSTEIEESVDGLTKNVRVKNKKSSPAYIRIRFEVSPEDAVPNTVIKIEGSNWVYDDVDEFWYYTKPVSGNAKTGNIVWSATNPEEIVVDTFDVLVYEESCVATSTNDPADIGEMKEAFKNADGE